MPSIEDFDPDNTLFLVDGQGYIFRAYYAIRRLSTSTGVSTNAVYGFTNMLMRVLRERQPRYLAIAFDLKGKTFRHELYPEYKGNRPPPPEDLPPQLPMIHDIVEKFQIPVLKKPGFEADDLIGTLARVASEQGKQVVIITADKDFMQLVTDDVYLYDEMRMQRGSDGVLVGKSEVHDKFGVDPAHVVDVLGLAGDSSDNVPGVKGIGVKTATALVNEHGDLEGVLAAAPDIKQKKRKENLINDADKARLSKQLVTIDTDVQMPTDIEALRYDGPDKAALKGVFHELEFVRLIDDPILEGAAAPDSDLPLFGGRLAEEKRSEDERAVVQTKVDRTSYREVTDPFDLASLARDLKGADVVSVRAFADGGRTLRGDLVGIAVAWGEGQAAYIPIGHDGEAVVEQLPLEDVREALAPVLTGGAAKVTGHDVKDTLTSLVSAGFPPFEATGDAMIAHYLLDTDGRAHDLVSLARGYLDHEALTPDEVLGKGKKRVSLRTLPVDRAAAFAAERADLAWRLHALLAARVAEREMGELYEELELPLVPVLSRMEAAGVAIDSNRLLAMSDGFESELGRLQAAAHEAAGREFNLGSPSQVAELLFDELKLPVVKRTKTGASTDSTVLEQLADKHPLPALLLEWRAVSKLKSTYVDVLPTLVNESTGRVHTHYHQAVAATGRLSSSDPNLQNIPIRTELGRAIREAFVAPAGSVLCSLDYSQVELRLLAHVTRDEVLLDTFEHDHDVHARTASEVFDTPLDGVTREQRTAAKAINFGLIYGMGVQRLSRELSIKRAEAKAYIDKYFQRLAGVKRWHNEMLDKARADGEVRTLFGRRRLLEGLSSKNRGEVARAERLAINTPIQGSAADLIKRAMLRADAQLRAKVPEAKLLLQVHDELLVEVPEQSADVAIEVVRTAMEGAAELAVPLKVDHDYAKSWADAH
jgi:DNA polymerase-1